MLVILLLHKVEMLKVLVVFLVVLEDLYKYINKFLI
jgi:hypothetical protein